MKRLFSLFALLLSLSALSAYGQISHTVTAGETLESIAAQYGTTPDAIMSANPSAGSMFFSGMKLEIPAGGAYTTDASFFESASLAAPGGGAASCKDNYRRSSLCLVLLTHSDKQYAEAMERVFSNFPMPHRYNEHNTNVRVVKVRGKQSKADIDRILRKENIANGVVSRWFNRTAYDGSMNMDLIHSRGGYGAFHHDYERAKQTLRGTDLLREEGIELLESTFVLVCDMDYLDKKKGFRIGAAIVGALAVASEVMGAVSDIQAANAYNKGDYSKARQHASNASAFHAGAKLGATGAAVLSDIGGFRVNIHAYLYRLRWDDRMTDMIFNNYWVDDTTPRSEAQRRKDAFENARFGLEYVGDYKAASGKTILLSWSNEDEVILDVCEKAVAKGISTLAKKFEVFRPRTPFYIEGNTLYSHIGTKEDVTPGKKYEVVQRTRNKKGETSYKRLGVVVAQRPWNNRSISFDDYFDESNKGTAFHITKGNSKDFAAATGLQIREMK